MRIPTNFLQRNGILMLLALFFLAGLENILLPIFDMHGWRQSLTLSIAHNFMQHPNIMYPRIDIGGEGDGIMSCEFPVYNYILAGIFKILGTHDWYARLFTWIVACCSLWFFHDLTRKTLNFRAATLATIVLMCSIYFEYARKTMPDTFAVSLTIMGIWFGWQYLEKGRRSMLISAALLITLGVLSKIPALIALSFLWIPMTDPNNQRVYKRNLVLWLSAGMVLVLAWYFAWMPYLLEKFHNQLIFPVSLAEGWKIIMEDRWGEAWRTITNASFYYKMPFIYAIMGLGVVLTGSQNRYKWFALTYIAIFFAFALKTGDVFITHEYYSIPLTPLWALLIGHFLDRLAWKPVFTYALLLVTMIPSYIHQKSMSFTPEVNRSYLANLSAIAGRFSQPEDKIMVNDGQFNPTMMYWAKRKGWTVNQDVPAKTTWMPDYKRDGLKYMFIDRHLLKDTLPYTLLYEDENFRVYKP